MIGAVIVAAGAGARLGGVAKALLPLARAEAGPAPKASGDEGASASIDTTFLGAIVRACARAGVDPAAIAIVVGAPHGDLVAREAARHALAGAVVWNDDPARGMASSVALGFAALARSSAHAALLWPVDHARVRAETIEALADALGGGEVAIPTFGGASGHPVLVGRALWPALAACDALPEGARTVIRAARAVRVPVDDDGVVRDVDRPEDL